MIVRTTIFKFRFWNREYQHFLQSAITRNNCSLLVKKILKFQTCIYSCFYYSCSYPGTYAFSAMISLIDINRYGINPELIEIFIHNGLKSVSHFICYYFWACSSIFILSKIKQTSYLIQLVFYKLIIDNVYNLSLS